MGIRTYSQIAQNRDVQSLSCKLLAARQPWSKHICLAFLTIAIFVLVLSSNTLYCRLMNNFCSIILLVLVSVSTFIGVLFTPIVRQQVKRTYLWAVVVLVGYVVTAVYNDSFGGGRVLCYFLLLAISPCMLVILDIYNIRQLAINIYVNIVTILAGISLILWLLGPIFGFISPNGTINSNWSGMGEVNTVDGYFGLLYLVQRDQLLGISAIRNTGIFVEAPMYSFTLSIAITLEVLAHRPLNKARAIVLALCIVSTLSTTGVVVLLLLATMLAWRKLGNRWKPLFICFVVLILLIAGYIVCSKIATSSGGTRVDDFNAGAAAWLENPVFGNGYAGSGVILSHMSEWRLHNMGFSNSPMEILSLGGLISLLPIAFGFAGYFVKSNSDRRCLGLIFVILWTVTCVSFLPVTALIVAYGVSRYTTQSHSWLRRYKDVYLIVQNIRILAICVLAGLLLFGGLTMFWCMCVLGPQYQCRTRVTLTSEATNTNLDYWLYWINRRIPKYSNGCIKLRNGLIVHTSSGGDPSKIRITSIVETSSACLDVLISAGDPAVVSEVANSITGAIRSFVSSSLPEDVSISFEIMAIESSLWWKRCFLDTIISAVIGSICSAFLYIYLQTRTIWTPQHSG